MMGRMKSKLDPKMPGDFGKFTEFMKRLVAVPHAEIKAELDAEKQAKKLRERRSSASRVSRAKG
jgi:hypothetical protein